MASLKEFVGVVKVQRNGKSMSTLSLEIRLHRNCKGFLMKLTLVMMTFLLWFIWLLNIIVYEDAIEVLK